MWNIATCIDFWKTCFLLFWHDTTSSRSHYLLSCAGHYDCLKHYWKQEHSSLEECRPLQGISSTDQESTSGWSGVWIRIRFRAGWLPKFFSKGRSEIKFSRRSDHFFERYEPNCGKMRYHLTVLKNLKKILHAVSDANDFQNLIGFLSPQMCL